MRISDWSSGVCSSDLAEYCTACNNFVDICISSMKDPVSEALSCAPPTALQRLTPAQMPELISLTSHPTPQHRRLRPRQYPRAIDRKNTRLNSSHYCASRLPSSA